MKEEFYFLTIVEFANEIRVHPNTVRNMIKIGRLSAFRTSAKKNACYRIARSEIQRIQLVDLEKYIEEKAADMAKGLKC